MSGAYRGIHRHGLLTAQEAADRAGQPLPATPRPTALNITLPDSTPVWITDNKPLSFKKLAPVLDDNLSPQDWFAMLNTRVFFWPDRKLGAGNLKARISRGYHSEWQIYDTAKLLAPIWDRAEIAPINTGSTIHQPARRGLATFAQLEGLDFQAWRKSRGKSRPDKIKEVTVRGSIPHAGDALLSIEPVRIL
ncbi:MAG: hypothetical protein AAFY75_17170 [Pseudomonadota bacterium]